MNCAKIKKIIFKSTSICRAWSRFQKFFILKKYDNSWRDTFPPKTSSVTEERFDKVEDGLSLLSIFFYPLHVLVLATVN